MRVWADPIDAARAGESCLPQSILFEGRYLFRRGGTGIGAYSRTLNAAARSLGYRTHGLSAVERRPSATDSQYNEILLFDAAVPRRTAFDLAGRWRRSLQGATLGVTPTAVTLTGDVIAPPGAVAAEFDRVFAAHRLYDGAEKAFRDLGRMTKLNFADAPAIFHAPYPVALRARRAANVYTLHDLVPLRLPYATLEDKKYFLALVRRLCREADHIVTVSETSKADILRITGMDEARISNTYQAVDLPKAELERPLDEVAAELRDAYGLEPGSYFLFYGAIEPKKNVARLIEAFAESGSKRTLVLAGGLGWQYGPELRLIADERFLAYDLDAGRITPRRRVRRLPHVPLDRLIGLIRGARAVLFPSIYEGFGLPILESMTIGAPVLASRVASLPEVAGDAALLIEPTDVKSIARGIRALDQDSDMCADLVAKGRARAALFSPERHRELLRAVYRRFAAP